jgi:hypothetical protein
MIGSPIQMTKIFAASKRLRMICSNLNDYPKIVDEKAGFDFRKILSHFLREKYGRKSFIIFFIFIMNNGLCGIS